MEHESAQSYEKKEDEGSRGFRGWALIRLGPGARWGDPSSLAIRERYKFMLVGYMVMPNHVHLLMTTLEDTTLERAVQLIKGGFSFRARKELGINSEIWQRGYVDHGIRDASDYMQHRNYIHANPVRAGLANASNEFRFSSASENYVLDEAPQGLKPVS